jgi:hypothetical protein
MCKPFQIKILQYNRTLHFEFIWATFCDSVQRDGNNPAPTVVERAVIRWATMTYDVYMYNVSRIMFFRCDSAFKKAIESTNKALAF